MRCWLHDGFSSKYPKAIAEILFCFGESLLRPLAKTIVRRVDADLRVGGAAR